MESKIIIPQTICEDEVIGYIASRHSEYAIWWREPETKIFPTIEELGIGFVPYCPLGRAS